MGEFECGVVGMLGRDAGDVTTHEVIDVYRLLLGTLDG